MTKEFVTPGAYYSLDLITPLARQLDQQANNPQFRIEKFHRLETFSWNEGNVVAAFTWYVEESTHPLPAPGQSCAFPVPTAASSA